MEVKGCRELLEEVIDAGLCAYCGACAVSQQVFGADYIEDELGAVVVMLHILK